MIDFSLFFFFFFLVDRVSIVIAFELARSSNLFAHCPRTYKKILRDFTSETGNFQYLFLIERLLYIIYIYISVHRWKNNSFFFFVEPFVFGIPRNHAPSLYRFEHNFRPRLKAFFLFFLMYIRGKHVYGHGGVTANGSRKILRPLYFLDLLTLLRIVDTPLHRIFQSCLSIFS